MKSIQVFIVLVSFSVLSKSVVLEVARFTATSDMSVVTVLMRSKLSVSTYNSRVLI